LSDFENKTGGKIIREIKGNKEKSMIL